MTDGSGQALLRRSKTNQEGRVLYLRPNTVKAWLATRATDGTDAPLFCRLFKGGRGSGYHYSPTICPASPSHFTTEC